MNWSIRGGVLAPARRSLPDLVASLPQTSLPLRRSRHFERRDSPDSSVRTPCPKRRGPRAQLPPRAPFHSTLHDRTALHWDIAGCGVRTAEAQSARGKKKGCGSEPHPSAVWRRCLRCPAYSFCRNSANSFSRDARRSTDSGTWIRTFARPSASKLSVAAFLFLTVNVWGLAST